MITRHTESNEKNELQNNIQALKVVVISVIYKFYSLFCDSCFCFDLCFDLLTESDAGSDSGSDTSATLQGTVHTSV